MSALIRQVALVSQSAAVPRDDVSKVAAALQKQATRDLGPIWEISATVDAFDSLDDVPTGYWPILVMDNIDEPGAAGIHRDDNGQPIALVSASGGDLDVWSVTASHEALEMLVDPSGNRLVAGDSPKPDQGRVNFLVEVADPSEASENGYTCNGILVSDFYTPNFFDPFAAAGVRYSFTGKIQKPRQILPGGYLSWQDPQTNSWWQSTWFDGAAPTYRELGPIDQSNSGSARAAIDRITMPHTTQALAPGRKNAESAGKTLAVVSRSTSATGEKWRRQVERILGRPYWDDRRSAHAPVRAQDAAFEPAPRVISPAAEAATTAAYDVAQATLLGQFIEAAYAMFNANPGQLTPPPSANFPPGYRLAAAIQMRDFVIGSTDPLFYGFVAQSIAEPNKFVLAFRGTSNGVEWWDDLHALGLTPFRVPGCGQVGEGFARIYNTIHLVEYPAAGPTAALAPMSLADRGSLSKQMAALVSRHAAAPPRAEALPAASTVSVTGHSLGAALATMYALENAKSDQVHNPLVCTFASPRVGDPTFAAAFNALRLTSWRFANAPDLVPQLPPPFFGFQHVDALCGLNSAGQVLPTFGCWHALETYLSLINPALKPGADCRLSFAAPSARAPTAAFAEPAAAPAMADDGSAELAAAMTLVCPQVNRAAWVAPLIAAFAKFGLTTNRRKAAAMGQFLVEAGPAFKEVVEKLHYSAERAAEVFPHIFPTPEDAQPFVGDPVRFGNHVYANRLGNGDEASGDGFRFCGRGLIQLTGRSEYSEFANSIGKTADEASRFCETPEGAAFSGCWYLKTRNCLHAADRWDIDAITRAVNGRAMLDAQLRRKFAEAFLRHLGDDGAVVS